MVPFVIYLFGVLPAIFLGFGFYMMKKHKDFSCIDTAVLYTKRYFLFLLVVAGLSFLICLLMWIECYFSSPNRSCTRQLAAGLGLPWIGATIAIAYSKAVDHLFYSPLKRHSEWVAVNGIFSTTPKSDIKSATESEVDIIKAEKLKQYSVADELMKWGKLKEEGHISEDEFNQAKAKLLKGTEKND